MSHSTSVSKLGTRALLCVVFFLGSVGHAHGANDVVINMDTCKTQVLARLDTQASAFQKQLEAFGELIDTATEELAIRGKTGVVNFGSDLEQICVTNLLSGSSGAEVYRVPACQISPERGGRAEAQRTDSVQSKYQEALLTCREKASQLEEKYEFVFLSFLEQDKNNKKTYTYARALESLGQALKKFNEDFSYMQGALTQVISSMTYLVSGKNGGQ